MMEPARSCRVSSFPRIGAAACSILLLAISCCAEEGSNPASPAPAPAKPLTLGGVTIHGSFRTRFEDWNWFDPGNAENAYQYSGNQFRISFSQSREFLDWQLELAVPFLLGLPQHAIAPGVQGQLGLGASYFAANDGAQNAASIFAKQAFVSFHRRTQSLRIGRFEFLDGSEAAPSNETLATLKRDRIQQRLIGNYTFSHVQRSVDGVQYLDSRPSGTFTFVGGLSTRGALQTDGWGENKTAFGYAAYTKPWGTAARASETRFMAIYYDDWRNVVKADDRPAAVRASDFADIRIFTFGGHHLSAVSTSAGTIDFLAWGVGQTGRWGRLDQRSYAFDLEAGIQPRVWTRGKPWLRFGYSFGSGDDNPNDGVHGTFFQLLPTVRPFARFPFFNMENNRDIMAALILRPHKKVTVSSEFHALELANANDLWYTGGGVFQPWTFGFTGRATGGNKPLANLYDTSVEYRFRPNITMTAYASYASGKSAIRAVYPKGPSGGLGYIELNYRF